MKKNNIIGKTFKNNAGLEFEVIKKVERINVIVPPGTKKRIIKVTDKSCNAFIREMVLAELNKLEKNNN